MTDQYGSVKIKESLGFLPLENVVVERVTENRQVKKDKYEPRMSIFVDLSHEEYRRVNKLCDRMEELYGPIFTSYNRTPEQGRAHFAQGKLAEISVWYCLNKYGLVTTDDYTQIFDIIDRDYSKSDDGDFIISGYYIDVKSTNNYLQEGHQFKSIFAKENTRRYRRQLGLQPIDYYIGVQLQPMNGDRYEDIQEGEMVTCEIYGYVSAGVLYYHGWGKDADEYKDKGEVKEKYHWSLQSLYNLEDMIKEITGKPADFSED